MSTNAFYVRQIGHHGPQQGTSGPEEIDNVMLRMISHSQCKREMIDMTQF